MDVERYLKSDDRVMLVTGACEQHGYLSLTTDVSIPMALADVASQQSGVPVAPPLAYGVSPYFEAFPGTISLRLETFNRVLTDLVSGLHRHGFRGVALLNGHGGNQAGRERLSEMANELDGLRLFWFSWWRSAAVQQVAEEAGRHPGHASWLEHFPFTEVAELPAGEAPIPEDEGQLWTDKRMRASAPDGVMGGPYQSNEDLQHKLFAAALNGLLAGLEAIRRPD